MSLHIVTDNYFYWCGMHDAADTLYLIDQDYSSTNTDFLHNITNMAVSSDDVFIISLSQYHSIISVLQSIKLHGCAKIVVESDFYLTNEMLMVANVVFLARKYSQEELKSVISELWKKPIWRCTERQLPRNNITKRNVTKRECSVLSMLVHGKSKSQISELLSISEKTITQHKISAIKKIGLNKLNDVEAYRLLRLLLAVKENPNKKLEFQLLNMRGNGFPLQHSY